jgi:4-alpha-glucanotransferase
MSRFPRSSGVLLHPTSFPGPYGIGELGTEARRFIDFLAKGGQRVWQIMPLGPTSYGDSPYQCLSAFAGNPYLISLDDLRHRGLVKEDELSAARSLPHDRVDYGGIFQVKPRIMEKAWRRWRERGDADSKNRFESWRAANASWLEDFVLFMALKDANGGKPWIEWPAELARRDGQALERCRGDLHESIERHRFLQFIFFEQWQSLRRYANERGVRIIGDLPIFVAYDSAEVWANPEVFLLDDAGHPTVVAGVPPDYFSATGQRWGNPLYRWDAMRRDGFAWWIERFRRTFELFDIVRIDHFRGFEACWEVPGHEETAMNGRWVKAPGAELFRAVKAALGDLPVIAEDLGLITPEVDALRRETGFPGMRVLHFAFDGDPGNLYLPHNYEANTVVYTGTHDNDTSEGWFATTSEKERNHCIDYSGRETPYPVHQRLMRLALGSVADTAIMPLQDLLGLGGEARMNVPGAASGNWSWRYNEAKLTDGVARHLRYLTGMYGRLPSKKR